MIYKESIKNPKIGIIPLIMIKKKTIMKKEMKRRILTTRKYLSQT